MVLRQVCAVSSAVAVISFLLACHPDPNQAIEVATPYLNQAIEVATPYLNHALAWTSSSQAAVITQLQPLAVMAAPYIDDAVAWISWGFQVVWNEKISIAEKAAAEKAAAEKAAAEKAAAEKAAAEKAAAEKAAAEKAAAEKAIKENINNGKSLMQVYFGSVEIKKEDVHAAERALKGDLVNSWDERVIHDTTTGIPVDKFEGFIDDMMEEFGMRKDATENLKKQFMSVLDYNGKDRTVWNFLGKENEFSSHFGFVSFNKRHGEIDAVYALHALQAKMADRVIKNTETEYVLQLIPWGTKTWQTTETVTFGTQQIDQIRNHWSRYRALVAFKENGLVNEINLIE